jgi:peroxiredoxin
MMNRRNLIIGGVAALVLVGAVGVALPVLAAGLAKGEKAPDFTLQAALGGKPTTFALADALKQGPVVVYFYPAAFTSGCNAEAHAFSEAIPEFKKAGATVIGVSGDGMDKLEKFSVEKCQSAFPVASDPGLKTAKKYDAVIMNMYANRVSFVVAQDGTIAYQFASMDPEKHIDNTLAAVKALKK